MYSLIHRHTAYTDLNSFPITRGGPLDVHPDDVTRVEAGVHGLL